MPGRRHALRVIPVTAALCALLSPPALAAPAAGNWSGKLDRYTSRLHFTVKGNHVSKFTVPDAPAYCLTGFAAITVYVPSATIQASKLSGTYKLTYSGETETIKLSGRINGRAATGSVHMRGPCDGTWTWTAHR
jgi:hypothetical protein